MGQEQERRSCPLPCDSSQPEGAGQLPGLGAIAEGKKTSTPNLSFPNQQDGMHSGSNFSWLWWPTWTQGLFIVLSQKASHQAQR